MLKRQEIESTYKREGKIGTNCDCLPACSSLQYGAEISQADFDWKNVLTAYNENHTEFKGCNNVFNLKAFIMKCLCFF